jgi:choline dehydrogenase
LRALGLDVVADRPGVGRNLQDHPLLTGMNFRAKQRLGLTRDNGGGAVMNWCSARARRPDLQAVAIQGRHASPAAAARYGLAGAPDVFAISPGLTGPASKGCLTVRDVTRSGPAAVEIDSGFLTERRDVDALIEAMDTVMDLAATAAYADVIDKPLLPPGRLSAADKEAFVRENCSTFCHPCGTAAMGTGADAVTDPELNVIGVEGLRVADASVIPVIPTGSTQAPVIAIAERAADLILGRAG